MTKRERYFYVFLGVFILWLAVIGTMLVYVLRHPDLVDPSLQLFAGVGAGLVTEFFLAMLTLSWQFLWRKKSPDENTPTA